MTNTATRLWVAAFVLLVFVSGLSIGLAVSARRGPGGPGRNPIRPGPPGLVSERIIGRLAGKADFTEDQRERLEALFTEREGRFRQFNREMRERFEAEQASLRDGVATILTPTQMEIFDAARRPGRRRQRPGPIRDPGLNRIE